MKFFRAHGLLGQFFLGRESGDCVLLIPVYRGPAIWYPKEWVIR